jgi:hypothetical protein
MMPPPPPTITVHQSDDPVAICTPERAYLAPVIEAMEPWHPDRELIEIKCLVAMSVLRGHVVGPYDDLVADRTARALLAAERAH